MKLFLNSAIMVLASAFMSAAQEPINLKASLTEKQFIDQAALSGWKEITAGNMARRKTHNQKVKTFGEMMASDHGRANLELKNLATSKNINLPALLADKNGSIPSGLNQNQKAVTNTTDKNAHGNTMPKTGEGVNSNINGTGSGTMISGSTSNTTGGISEPINKGEPKISTEQEVSSALGMLNGLDGLAFDNTYVPMMISDHQNAILLFEAAEKLSDPQIKAFASKNLPVLRHHLKEIKDIGASLNGSPKNTLQKN
jgi:putative membrane protein